MPTHSEPIEKSKALSPAFVSVCFVFMLLGSLGVSWMHFQSYTPQDIPYVVTPMSPQAIKNFGGHPGIVNVGLIIENFHTFQMIENKFTFSGTLWFRFDPNLVSLETIDKIIIKNGKFIEKSPPHIRLVGELLFVRYAIQAEFQCHLDFKAFPDDDHALYIIFTHPGVSPNSLMFQSARPNLAVLDSMERQGWRELDKIVEAGYSSNNVQSAIIDIEFTNPVVAFIIFYRHNTMRNLLNILLPLLVMMGLVLLSFAVDREKFGKQRLEAPIQAIAASIAFRFVIDSMSPKVGYTMASDKFFFMFLFFYLIMFVVALNTHRLNVPLERAVVIAMSLAVVVGTTLIWTTG